MKKLFAVIILTLAALSGSYSQQFPSDLWHEGKLVLANEEVYEGLLKYDLERGIVQVEQGEKVFTFSAQSIFYFKIYDVTVEANREFYVLPYGLVSNYKAPVIFEVLVEGNISLLCREHISSKSVTAANPYMYNTPTYQREVLVYDYYFLDRKGNITPYNLKKRELMQAVAQRQSQVSDYIKKNRLKFDRRTDIIRIIAFYNALI
jgi:hypothetical protein